MKAFWVKKALQTQNIMENNSIIMVQVSTSVPSGRRGDLLSPYMTHPQVQENLCTSQRIPEIIR
jgi:hypothetical protein